jgi:hypothetical protein
MFSWRRARTTGGCTIAAGAARDPGLRYWLIVKNDNGRMEALTLDLDGQETMPIFSFSEEAEMYIRFEAWDGWWVRETSAEELVSLLFGPYSHVEMMALDPLPEICDEGMIHLVCVRREDFARKLLLGDPRISVAPAPRPIALRARREGGNHHSMPGRELRRG